MNQKLEKKKTTGGADKWKCMFRISVDKFEHFQAQIPAIVKLACGETKTRLFWCISYLLCSLGKDKKIYLVT